MGLAENQLSFDLLESWLKNNPDSAGFKPDNHSLFKELALFQDYHGLPAFKNVSYPQMFRRRRKTVAAKIRGFMKLCFFNPTAGSISIATDPKRRPYATALHV
ncbi:hypothetical protein LXL04_009137 [Taraxacum kok-saghyz]